MWAWLGLGGGAGAGLALLGAWLYCRGLIAQRDAARLERDAHRERAADFKAESQELSETLARERTRAERDLERARQSACDERARLEAVILGQKLVLARMRKHEAEHATPDSAADRIDDLGRVLELPASSSGSANTTVPPSGVPAGVTTRTDSLRDDED